MSRRMDGYRKSAGLKNSKKKKTPRKETVWELVKRAFSYERSTGIVDVSTVPFVTERWRNGERQIYSFLVTLPIWVPEKKILEAINLGFGFLKEETEANA